MVVGQGARQLASFVGAGVASLAVDMGGLVLLHAVLGVPPGPAATVSFLASFAINFSWNRHLTFATARGDSRWQLLRFTTVVALNSLLTGVAVSAMVSAGLHYVVAKLLVVAVLFFVNFFVLRGWVFRSSRAPGVNSPS